MDLLERLIIGLRNTQNPTLTKIFGFPQSTLESDPELQSRILARTENRVYGKEGLKAYEETAPSEIARLARRSLAHFLCQQDELDALWIRVVWWLGMAISIPPLILYLMARTVIDGRHFVPEEAKEADIIIRLLSERLRKTVSGVFKNKRLYIHSSRQIHFGLAEWAYFLRVCFSYPRILLHPKLIVNLLRWLSYYGYIVHRFAPKAIAHSCELVVSSSLITGFLRERGARHINVTHGERVYSATAAFCEFDEDYVWGEHFKEIALRVKEKAHFVVGATEEHIELYSKVRNSVQPRPKRLLIIHNPYLSPTGKEYPKVIDLLALLDSSWEVVIRRHPQWTECCEAYVQALRKEQALKNRGVIIREEPPHSLPLRDALIKSRIVMGSSSTAMIEAAIAGCKLIYIAGAAHPSILMDRFCRSENVLLADTASALDQERFISEPAILTADEDTKMRFLIQAPSSISH